MMKEHREEDVAKSGDVLSEAFDAVTMPRHTLTRSKIATRWRGCSIVIRRAENS